jgi:hypothetical protein
MPVVNGRRAGMPVNGGKAGMPVNGRAVNGKRYINVKK